MCRIRNRRFVCSYPRREYWKTGFAALIICLVIWPIRAITGAESASPPNIVLCMADDQGWGDVGYNGHPVLKTPNLDLMAREGLRLDRFYAAAPVCSPTRGSVLTGRHPNRFGCFSWGHTLRPDEVTVAQLLKQAGYATGHFGKWHLGSVRKDSRLSPGAMGFEQWLSTPNFYDLNPLMSDQGTVVRKQGDSSIIAAEAADEFIRKAVADGRPFLAVVWFGSPHAPHRALDEDRNLYADQPAAVRDFLGEITALDRAVGLLRQTLRDCKVEENTLFWYTSDNGAIPQGSTGGLRGRKGTLWEGGLRVPCVIEWPRVITRPRVSDFPCGTVDILPTVADVAGIAPPHRVLDGISLRRLLEDRITDSHREKPLGFWVYPEKGIATPSESILADLLAEQTGEKPASPPPKEESLPAKRYPDDVSPGHAAWLDWPYKLHRIPQKNGGVTWELYDVRQDPAETTNLAEQDTDRVQRMAQALEAWQRSVLQSLNGEETQ